jgi:hypothetical protein
MRHAFVLQLGSETEASRRNFVGSIEEVCAAAMCFESWFGTLMRIRGSTSF